ncbi:MAG: hypothetical protein IT328_24770 [Caldilineaceae bacterium]|nr:hypothetical protein [Caldilineaceae bacterium]
MQSYDTNRQPARPRAGLNTTLPRPTPASLLYAGIGGVLGLLLGLIFAWVIWPVQWTDAWPADLSQEARAQYLAAVAESYVYYGDAQAAEVARNRLFNLNEDLATAIADAQAFFVDNPQASSRVYVSNLGQLAQALNVQSPDIIIDTPVAIAPAAGEAPASGDIALAPTEEGAVGDGVRAWVNWALTVLAAIVLVGGGFYVVGRLNQRRLAGSAADTLDDDADGFDDEPGGIGYIRPVPASGNSQQTNPYMRPLRGAGGVAMPTSVPPARGAPSRHGEEYGFDDDDSDDDPYTGGGSSRAIDYREEDEIFDDPDDELDNSFDESETLYAPRRTSQIIDPMDHALDTDLESDLDDELEELDEDVDEGETLAAEPAILAPTQSTTGRAPGQVRTLNTYTFQYHAGIADYDQSRPIVDPETGLQVGDCGMGVNMKNNIVQNNPDNVIALDVWLVDKKQEKSFSSQDRVLLSEYVVDHSLEQTFSRERPNDPSPIVPQPGTTFQIKGPSLLLDCVVTEATYIKNGAAAGMFQSISIDMTVRSRA